MAPLAHEAGACGALATPGRRETGRRGGGAGRDRRATTTWSMAPWAHEAGACGPLHTACRSDRDRGRWDSLGTRCRAGCARATAVPTRDDVVADPAPPVSARG